MYSIFNAKEAITPRNRSFVRKGLFSAVAASAFFGGEALSHTVFANGSTSTTGPLYNGQATPDLGTVPHTHSGIPTSSQTSTITTTRSSAEPGIVNIAGQPGQFQTWSTTETASTTPVMTPTSYTETTQVTLLDPLSASQMGDVATSVTTKNFRNVQRDVTSTEKLNDGSLALTLKDGGFLTANAGDYAFNNGEVWLASNIAGDLGMVTQTTSVLSKVYGIGGLGGWALPVAAGVAGMGALGLGAAALTGNLGNPFARDNDDDDDSTDGEDGADGSDGADGADGEDGTDGGDGSDDDTTEGELAGDGDGDGEGEGEEEDDGTDPEFVVTNTDPENEGPTALTFSEFYNNSGSFDLLEIDSMVGSLSATDPEGDELQYRIHSQHLGTRETNIFEINEENQLIITERLDYSQPGNDADGTKFDENKATVVIEVSDGSEKTTFRSFEFTISNSNDDDQPYQYVREADITRLKYNGKNSTNSGSADSTDWLPFMDEAEYARGGNGEDLIVSIHSDAASVFSVHELNGEGGFSGTKNYSVNDSAVIDEKYHIHEVIAVDVDDIDGDGDLDVAVAGRGGTSGSDSVVQIWEAGGTGVFSFQAADKDSEPASVRDVIIGHFNKETAGQETSVTNMKKVMVIGGGTDSVASEDALYTISFVDNRYQFEGTQMQGNWHFDEVESVIINDKEFSVGTYGNSDGTGIGMASLETAEDGIVSAGAGIKHNDVAVINNIVFTATDSGIYYNKAFHTHLDTPESVSISNEGLHISDIKASQIESGNFDGDSDLELAVLDVLDQTPIIRFFDVDPTSPQVITQLYTTEPVPGASELLVIPAEIEKAERGDGNIGADELLVGISQAGTATYFNGADEEITQTWNGSIIFYDDTSL